jgi:hypothetical protein
LKNANHIILFLFLCNAAAFYAGRITTPESAPIKARNLEIESLELVNRQIKTPDGTTIVETITRKRKSKSASVEKAAAPISRKLYRLAIIPNYNFESRSLNYGFVAEKKFIGGLSLGVFINLTAAQKLSNAGLVASYEF